MIGKKDNVSAVAALWVRNWRRVKLSEEGAALEDLFERISAMGVKFRNLR